MSFVKYLGLMLCIGFALACGSSSSSTGSSEVTISGTVDDSTGLSKPRFNVDESTLSIEVTNLETGAIITGATFDGTTYSVDIDAGTAISISFKTGANVTVLSRVLDSDDTAAASTTKGVSLVTHLQALRVFETFSPGDGLTALKNRVDSVNEELFGTAAPIESQLSSENEFFPSSIKASLLVYREALTTIDTSVLGALDSLFSETALGSDPETAFSTAYNAALGSNTSLNTLHTTVKNSSDDPAFQGEFVKKVGFSSFNDQEAALEAEGLRVFGPNATLAQDLEPEYVAVSSNSMVAWVSLQENNGLARIDLSTDTVTDIFPLGFKDYGVSANQIDPSDKDDGYSLMTATGIVGMYQPDGIATYQVNGVDYVITANEGDAREYEGSPGFIEEERVGDVTLDQSVYGSLDTSDNVFGRLKLTLNPFSSTPTSTVSQIYSFGARSFSIWNGSTGALVYDSGSDLAVQANLAGVYPDGRSDDKGTEPETVAIGTIGQAIYAFIALERADVVAVYNVTDPTNASFVQMLTVDGADAPEGVLFISESDSPTGSALVVVSYEDSGTVTAFQENNGSFSEIHTITLNGGEGAAEISAFDPMTNRLFVVNNGEDLSAPRIDVLSLSSAGFMAVIAAIDVSAHGGGVNSVAVSSGNLAAAIEASNKQARGVIAIFDTSSYQLLGKFPTGSLPDMVTFTPDGTKIVVANEGEPNDDYTVDPEGSISVIDVDGISSMSTSSDNFQLQILHSADADGDGDLINNTPIFSALLNKFRSEYPNSVTLYSGDAWIPGSYYTAGEDSSFTSLVGDPLEGRPHVAFLNAMGFQASVFGNHEFDNGTSEIADLLAPSGNWSGAHFPYLSTNLDFSTDSNLSPLIGTDGANAESLAGKVAAYTIIEVNGQSIGIIGATTPNLGNISSPEDVGVSPSDPDDLEALAALIQADIDALTGQGVNKIILLSHMQQLSIEQSLAALLSGVDVIIGGGSNSVLTDSDDTLRAGHSSVGTYPMQLTGADQNPVLLINTDGDYEYLGRLLVTFNSSGIIQTSALDVTKSGAYPTDSGALSRNGVTSTTGSQAVTAISSAISAYVSTIEGTTFGSTSVFINGERGEVRTEETNLGNLTADANKWYAQQQDSTVVASIKNGGGIRASIGQIVALPGSTEVERTVTAEIPGVKESGDISQNDIQTSLRFNNSLTLLTLSATQLKQIIEHGVAATAAGATPGQFAQVSGLSFTYDPNGVAQEVDSGGNITTPGFRIRSLQVLNSDGTVSDTVVTSGNIVGDATRTFRIVTLGYLAGGGDSYPFPSDTAANVVDLEMEGTQGGNATFADDGTEQDALAEYLLEMYSSTPFGTSDDATDTRIMTSTYVSSILTANFNDFDDQEETLEAAGLRVFGPNATLSMDVEPEYVTVSSNSMIAWVSLQENNGLARVDLTTGNVTDIFPLGFKDYGASGNEIDPSDEGDGFGLVTATNILGMYQPDGIASYQVNGVDYVVTANEGDAREYEGTPGFIEEERVADVTLDMSVYSSLNTSDNNFGRLKLTLNPFSSTASTNIDQIYSFGARSFSIWNGSTGALVYDSGSDLASQANIAGVYPDGRSDDKGTEPENVAMGNVGGMMYAFIALERADAIAVYNVTDPTNAVFEQMLTNSGDDAPEGVIFISDTDSPTGGALTIVSSEDSGDVTVYDAQGLSYVDNIELTGGEGAAEITAFDASTNTLFVVNNGENNVSTGVSSPMIDVVSVSNTGMLTYVTSIDVSSYGGGINSVAVSGGKLAAAMEADDKQANGSIALFDTSDYSLMGVYPAGALPDMVTFSPDGTKIIVANEGEPNDDYDNDPEGTITIIELNQ